MNQRLYDFFVHRSPFLCYALTIFMFGSIVFVWVRFIYSEEQKKNSWYQEEIATLRKHARMISKLAGDEKRKKVMMDSTVSDQDHQLISPSHDLNQAIDFFLEKAAVARLQVRNCVTQGEKNKEFYRVYPILLKFLGTFDALCSFFKLVTASTYLVRCGPLFVEKENNNQIAAHCILNFYQFSPSV